MEVVFSRTLSDLIRLENRISSGSVSFTGDCNPEEKLRLGNGFIVVDSLMPFARCLN